MSCHLYAILRRMYQQPNTPNPKSTYIVWVNNNKCSRTLLPKIVSVGLNMDKVLRVEEEGLDRLRIKCVGVWKVGSLLSFGCCA